MRRLAKQWSSFLKIEKVAVGEGGKDSSQVVNSLAMLRRYGIWRLAIEWVSVRLPTLEIWDILDMRDEKRGG